METLTMLPSRHWTPTRRGPVATLRFGDPPSHRLTFEALLELDTQLAECAKDQDVRVIALAGASEECFVSHASLEDIALLQSGATRAARAWNVAFRRLESVAQPVVAVLGGEACGGGMELALACDLRLALPTARIRFPEIDLGLIPGAGAMQRLARLMGPTRTTELILSGRTMGAEEAAAVGLVQLVADPAAVSAILDDLAAKPKNAVQAALRVMRESRDLTFRDALRREAELFSELLQDPESRQRVALARAVEFAGRR